MQTHFRSWSTGRPDTLHTIKLAAMHINKSIFILCLSACLASHAQAPGWQSSSPGFHPLAIVSNEGAFWVCGPNESIASSPDGENWTIHHRASGAGAMLFGIEFFSAKFGYAYGTGGTVLFTSDGGDTWEAHHFGSDTILLASFSDPTHGLFRTAPSLYYLDGNDSPQQIVQPADTLQRFAFTPFLVALSPDKMTAVLTEGPTLRADSLRQSMAARFGVFTIRLALGSKTFCALMASIGLLGMKSSVRTNPAEGMVFRWLPTPTTVRIGHILPMRFIPATGSIASSATFRAA